MFWHLYKYCFLSLIRRKELIFWAMLFPIILGTLFKAGFGSSTSIIEDYTTIPVALTMEQTNEQSELFLSTITSVSFNEDTPMFDVIMATQEEGAAMVKDGTVEGQIIFGDSIQLVFSASGLNQSIIKIFADQYQQNTALTMHVLANDPSKLADAMTALHEDTSFLQEVSLGGEKIDSMLQYFYALIAMACLYGNFLGLQNAESIQANLTALGARRHVTPTHHMKLIVADTLAAFTIHFANILVVCAYLRFILRVQIGTQPVYFLLVCLFGSIIGVTLGLFIGSVSRKSNGIKIALSLGLSMVFSMLGGLMFSQMKYIIEQKAPFINRINPVALISDAFFSLSVYDDYSRYISSLVTLGAMAVILIIASFIAIRRSRYASL